MLFKITFEDTYFTRFAETEARHNLIKPLLTEEEGLENKRDNPLKDFCLRM